jgi:hypothetical protein
MIAFSPSVAAILASGHIEAFMMFRIMQEDNDAKPNFYAATSYYRDIQLIGTNHNNPGYTPPLGFLYPSDDSLVALDPPQATTNVDREQYQVSIADPSFSLLHDESFTNMNDTDINSHQNYFSKRFIGRSMETRIGFIETRPNIVDSPEGHPLVNINDTIIVYRGRIDGVACSIDTGAIGSLLINISGSSPMRNLDLKKSVYLSRDFMRKRDPKDSSCDQVYGGSGKMILKWGRA